jgi:tetratricopeptide (TPR) repeat protein
MSPQRAQAYLQQALGLAQTIQAPEIAYQWHWQLGLLAKQAGLPQQAIAHYQEAIAALQSVRRDLVVIRLSSPGMAD